MYVCSGSFQIVASFVISAGGPVRKHMSGKKNKETLMHTNIMKNDFSKDSKIVYNFFFAVFLTGLFSPFVFAVQTIRCC
jgi:hypothetical protein